MAADGTGVYLVGTLTKPANDTGIDDNADDTDAFLVKYDALGDMLWEISWGTPQPDIGNGVAVDSGSRLVYVVGTTKGAMGTDGPSSDPPDAGATSQSEAEEGEEGDLVVPGSKNAGASDVFLTCLDAGTGELKWTVQLGSVASDVGNKVSVGPRGSVYLTGQLGDDNDVTLAGARAFLAKYDYLGNQQVPGQAYDIYSSVCFQSGCRTRAGVITCQLMKLSKIFSAVNRRRFIFDPSRCLGREDMSCL